MAKESLTDIYTEYKAKIEQIKNGLEHIKRSTERLSKNNTKEKAKTKKEIEASNQILANDIERLYRSLKEVLAKHEKPNLSEKKIALLLSLGEYLLLLEELYFSLTGESITIEEATKKGIK